MLAMANFQKFIFLGVVMMVAALASQGFHSSELANISGGLTPPSRYAALPPIFVLAAPQPVLQDRSAPVAPYGQSDTSAAPEVRDIASNLIPGLPADVLSSSSAESSGGNVHPSAAMVLPQNQAGSAALASEGNPATSGFRRTGDDLPPILQAQAALVSDLQSGEVFFGFNINRRWPLASLTKLVAAAVAWDNLSPQNTLILDSSDFSVVNRSSTLALGGRFTENDLFKAMLVVSSNEATEALAGSYGRDNFIARMMNYIANWNLNDTHFDDPTGLSSSDQSTIFDLKQLTFHLWNDYPYIFKITRTPSVYVTELNSGRRLLLQNINSFAGKPDFLGGKTGYTDDAIGNLLSVFSYKGRPVLIIVLGTTDRFGETQALLKWFEDNFR